MIIVVLDLLQKGFYALMNSDLILHQWTDSGFHAA